MQENLLNPKSTPLNQPIMPLKELETKPIIEKPNPFNLPRTPLNDFEAKKKEVLNLLDTKAKELKDLGILDQLAGFIGYQTDDFKKREQSIGELKDLASTNKIDYENLPKALKDDYYNKAETSIFNPLKTNKTKIAKEDYNKDIQRKAILDKKSTELTQSDKELIKADNGLLNNAIDYFTDKSELEQLKDFKEKEKAKVATKEIQKAWNAFNNIRSDKDFFSMFSAEDEKQRENYKNEFKTIAKGLGFDDVIYNQKHEPFVVKGEKVYKINDGFVDNFLNSIFDNKFSLAGSLAGAYQGAKIGKNVGILGALGGGILGGSVGAIAGGATDAMLTNYQLNREQNVSEILKHALSEGALSLAGDTLTLGAGKLAKNSVKPLAKLGELGLNVTTGGGYGLAKRMLNGNTKRAAEIIENSMSKEDQEMIKKFSQNFGGKAKLQNPKDDNIVRNYFSNKYGEESKTTKAYDTIMEGIRLNKFSEQQEAFLQAIRADETGNVIAFLTQAANESPKANLTLKNILNKTTQNLENELSQLNLQKSDIKGILNDLDTGTKESYTKAIDSVIAKVYDDSYKITPSKDILNLSRYQKFRKDLHKEGELEESALKMLNYLERNIYNPNGVNFSQLHNAKNTINAYLRNIKDPSIKGYIQKEVGNFIKDDIQNATTELLKQNTSAYEKFSKLYDSAISDYKIMKDTLKLSDEFKLLSKKKTEDEVIENLLKLAKGQGGETSNFKVLTKGLSEQNKEVLELNMLNSLMQKSMQSSDSLKVFDSQSFFKNLADFKDDVFTSKGAKDFIDIAKGFDTLFRNDAKIANELTNATTGKPRQGLATTIDGFLKYAGVKWFINTFHRTMPKIYVLGKGFDESSAGAALRYHLKQALERSESVEEFAKNLKASTKKSKFTNKTNQLIDEIIGGVKATKEESELAFKQESKQASKQAIETNTKQANNETEQAIKPFNEIKKLIDESPSTGSSMLILGDKNLNAEAVEYIQKNHKRVAVENLEPSTIEYLGLPHKDARAVIDYQAINHILKRHNNIKLDDIANYRQLAKNAQETFKLKNGHENILTSFNQVNGFFVVVEQVSNGKNELILKTMYKTKGNYKDSKVYKETIEKSQSSSNFGYEPSATSIENSTSINPTTNTIKTQEPSTETQNLSLLDQANKEKQAKLNEQALKEQEQELKAKAKSLELEKQRQEIREAKESVSNPTNKETSYNQVFKNKPKDTTMPKLSFNEIKELIDKSPRTGSSMLILGDNNLDSQVVEYIQKNHKRIAVENLEPSTIGYLGLPHKDARAVIDYQAINHVLKDHPNLEYKDIANYRELAKNANETLKSRDNQYRQVIVSFNQVNGYFVVVEQVMKSKNELALKTMYKSKGNYKDSLIYRKTLAKSQNSD
ncbi:hypothetical protein [Helicobacter cetorum]|uniref:PBECR3 domain-containing polyvalent protein n=1 Tax=Helicobacter cetorum TaxID=138563 RepID=UPI001F183D92|nr:hypothetical protein [Helicobacter cetorum]